jgi:hypothetical protein
VVGPSPPPCNVVLRCVERQGLRTEIEYRIAEEYAQLVVDPNEGKRIDNSIRVIRLDTGDSRWASFARLYSANNGRGFFGWSIQRRYSLTETKGARLHFLNIKARIIPTGEECGTLYSDVEMCPLCGAGRIQTSPLRLNISKTPGRAEIAQSWGGEVIVSTRVVRLLIDSKMSGFGLGPVQRSRKGEEEAFTFMETVSGQHLLHTALQAGIEYPSPEFYIWIHQPQQRDELDKAIREHQSRRPAGRRLRGGTSPDWYQLFVTSTPVELSPSTLIGSNPFDHDEGGKQRCPLGLPGHVAGLNLLSQVTVDGDAWETADFLRSRDLVGVRRGLLNPKPLLFISPRLRDLLSANAVRGWSSEAANVA